MNSAPNPRPAMATRTLSVMASKVRTSLNWDHAISRGLPSIYYIVKMAETRHVALLVETSNAYARGLLVGIKKYLVTHPGWSIYLGEHSRQETDLSWLGGWRGDGVIARIENAETARQVRRL